MCATVSVAPLHATPIAYQRGTETRRQKSQAASQHVRTRTIMAIAFHVSTYSILVHTRVDTPQRRSHCSQVGLGAANWGNFPGTNVNAAVVWARPKRRLDVLTAFLVARIPDGQGIRIVPRSRARSEMRVFHTTKQPRNRASGPCFEAVPVPSPEAVRSLHRTGCH